MFLISAFRRAAFPGVPLTRALPARRTAHVAPAPGYPRTDRPLEPRDDRGLTCRWEVVEDQTVQLGGQMFRCGNMLMHWMPVH
ncbi:MAG TPA: hypothetical protein VHB98_11635 [Chloroflexota bacterium]|nr:hypothetical protein [Chloroflexota bacterium]